MLEKIPGRPLYTDYGSFTSLMPIGRISLRILWGRRLMTQGDHLKAFGDG
jgi:hypothetical protein